MNSANTPEWKTDFPRTLLLVEKLGRSHEPSHLHDKTFFQVYQVPPVFLLLLFRGNSVKIWRRRRRDVGPCLRGIVTVLRANQPHLKSWVNAVQNTLWKACRVRAKRISGPGMRYHAINGSAPLFTGWECPKVYLVVAMLSKSWLSQEPDNRSKDCSATGFASYKNSNKFSTDPDTAADMHV